MEMSLSRYPSPAKTYTVEFPRLTGGLNLWELDYRMSPDQSPNVKNLWWKDGVLQCRDGQRYLSENTELGAGYTCCETLFWGQAIFHIGTGLYYADPAAEQFVLRQLCTGVPEGRGTFFRYLDWLFYKNKGGYFRISYDPEEQPCFCVDNMAELGYVPVVLINADPAFGSGDLYQPENRLSPAKTVRYNASRDVTEYHLPVQGIEGVDRVTVDGTELTEGADYTVDPEAGTVKFTVAPPVTEPASNNTVEITYRKENKEAWDAVMDCTFAMVAGGDTNLCVLMAGSAAQPNAVFWNDRNSLSMDPGYFPMSYYNLVGDTRDPVTGFGRQYSDIIVLKEHSVGRLEFGVETEKLDGRSSISFTYTAINSKVGCDLPRSIQLIENNLVFCNTYQGVHIIRSSSAAYENNVECISRNVNGTDRKGLLRDVRRAEVVCSFDDDGRYWLCADGHVYLWDYVLSTATKPSWFYFEEVNGVAYFHDDARGCYHLDRKGRVTGFTRTFTDYDRAIDKVYQFPARDLGGYDRRKDITAVLIAVRSDTDTDVTIRYDTDWETRYDRTAIRAYSWRLVPRNLAYRYLGVARYANAVRRKPGCRRVRHFSMTFQNNEVGCDLAVVSAQIQYKVRGKER